MDVLTNPALSSHSKALLPSQFHLHLGPPNSGKTHDGLQALVAAGGGWYLAPLRLLAFEVFDRLNRAGVPCNLLTGEEQISMKGAAVTAATVEMFNPSSSGPCVVVDEVHMLSDPARGWAWTRAILETQAPEVHLIGSPLTRSLVQKLLTASGRPLTVIPHRRLSPLGVARKPWKLEHLPPRTILVAFSRREVLHLKSLLERQGRRVSVIYGALPPEVRRNQAERFAQGASDVCIATDAVGMGLNLPADYVCFAETQKFDGQTIRPLSPLEVQQIGGRAGRYGLSTGGEVGATNTLDLAVIRALYRAPVTPLPHAYVAPAVEELVGLPGTLAEKLTEWSKLHSVPPAYKSLLRPADLQERIALAALLSPHDIAFLGLAAAVTLTNAPTREGSREYWLRCASALVGGDALPLPPFPPLPITSQMSLERTETAIACADVYLWLVMRREFAAYGSHKDTVSDLRASWSRAVDEALVSRLDTRLPCPICRRPRAQAFVYGVCTQCYENRRRSGFGRKRVPSESRASSLRVRKIARGYKKSRGVQR
jgi:ATP-dependent RNA helicase SUPV3L1/SUV3